MLKTMADAFKLHNAELTLAAIVDEGVDALDKELEKEAARPSYTR